MRRLGRPALAAGAARQGVTPAAVALASTLREPGVIANPKAANPEHLRASLAALDVRLTADDLAALDAALPPPHGPARLEKL